MSCTIDELKKKYNEYRLITNRLRRDKGFTVQEAEFEKYVKEKTKVSRGIFTKIESEGRYFGNKSLTGETVASMRYRQLIFNPYQINNVLFNSILGMIHTKTKSSYNMNSRKFELIFGKDKTFKTNLNSEDIKNINDFVKLIDPKALIIDDKQSKIYLPFIEFNMIDNLYNRIIKEHRNIIPLFYNRKKGEKLKVKFLFYPRDFCKLLDDFFSKVPENLKNNFRSYILEGAKKGAVAGGKLVAGALVKGSRSAGGIAYNKTKELTAFLKQKFNSLPEAREAILRQIDILEVWKNRIIQIIRSRNKAGSESVTSSAPDLDALRKPPDNLSEEDKKWWQEMVESAVSSNSGSGSDTVVSPAPLTKENLKLHDTATSSDTSSLFGPSVAASSDTGSDTITTINKDISFLSKLLESTNKQISSYAGVAAGGVKQAYEGLISIPGILKGAYYNPKRKVSVGAPPEENKKNKNNQYKNNMFSRIFRKAREQAKRFQDYTSAKSQQFSNYAQDKKRQLSRSASFYGQQLKGYVKGRPDISGPTNVKFNPYNEIPPPPPVPGSLQYGVQNPQLKTKNMANIIRSNSEEQRMDTIRQQFIEDREEKQRRAKEEQRLANIAQAASKRENERRQQMEKFQRKRIGYVEIEKKKNYDRLYEECGQKTCNDRQYAKSPCQTTPIGRKVCDDKAVARKQRLKEKEKRYKERQQQVKKTIQINKANLEKRESEQREKRSQINKSQFEEEYEKAKRVREGQARFEREFGKSGNPINKSQMVPASSPYGSKRKHSPKKRSKRSKKSKKSKK